MPTTLDPLGVSVSDAFTGDVTDQEVVASALDGCDAVVHAAAVYSVDPRRAEEMRTTNALAADLVLGEVVRRGLDPVVHTSSTVVLARFAGTDPSLPFG